MFLLVTYHILYYNVSMKTDLWNYLKQTKKPIVLYGMGNGADKIIKVLENRGIEIKGVFASDGFVRSKTFHGFKLISYSEAKEQFGDMIVLLCFGSALEDVIDNIKLISKEHLHAFVYHYFTAVIMYLCVCKCCVKCNAVVGGSA